MACVGVIDVGVIDVAVVAVSRSCGHEREQSQLLDAKILPLVLLARDDLHGSFGFGVYSRRKSRIRARVHRDMTVPARVAAQKMQHRLLRATAAAMAWAGA
eukprot:657324-Pleurochrysis_carterae.AAC.2